MEEEQDKNKIWQIIKLLKVELVDAKSNKTDYNKKDKMLSEGFSSFPVSITLVCIVRLHSLFSFL